MGYIRTEDEFYGTIHTYTDELYLLIHPFDSEESIRIAIKSGLLQKQICYKQKQWI